MEQFKIAINNSKGIIDWAVVSKEHYEHLNKFKWHFDKDGYTKGRAKGKTIRMHRYIFNTLLGKEIHGRIIDHINNNKLDNRIENLRIITSSENSRNKRKKIGTTSKYIGVSAARKSWEVGITINGKRLRAIYKEETWAAYQYNIWIDRYKLSQEVKNVIEKPKDFIEKSMIENRELPLNIHKISGGYRVKIKNIIIGSYLTLEEAIKIKEYTLQEHKRLKLEEKKKNNPLREFLLDKTQEIVYYFVILKNEKESKIIIDKERYDEVIKYTWIIRNDGYIMSSSTIFFNGKLKKNIYLHRFIKNYEGNNVIDHINNDPLDNRDCNLRVVTHQQNSQNSSRNKSHKNKYRGIYLRSEIKQTYSCVLQLNEKKILYKLIKGELNAVNYRDKFIIANREILNCTPLNLAEEDYIIRNGHILYKNEIEDDSNKIEIFKKDL